MGHIREKAKVTQKRKLKVTFVYMPQKMCLYAFIKTPGKCDPKVKGSLGCAGTRPLQYNDMATS